MSTYTLKSRQHYRAMIDARTSDRLFNAAWRQYRAFLVSSIDDPTCDEDVIGWLETIMSERVNNSRSTFYIHGR